MASHERARIQKYYIPFVPQAKVDYRFLIMLYGVAEYNKETKCFDTIQYKSISSLSKMLEKSPSALNSALKNKEYKPFFTIDKTAKRITINNNMAKEKKPFVCLSLEDIYFLTGIWDNLLCKYYIYLKYYCGYTKSKTTDGTAKQFLQLFGYSVNSSYIDKVSEYNTLLKAEGLISIKTYRDESGNKRNIYSIP